MTYAAHLRKHQISRTEKTTTTRLKLLAAIVPVFLAGAANAQIERNLTVPPYHWVADYLEEWQLRSPAPGFFTGARPIDFTEVWNYSLQRPRAGNQPPLLRAVLDEFRKRFWHPGAALAEDRPYLDIGGIFVGEAGASEGESQSTASYRVFTGLGLSDRVQIVNTLNFDEALKDDPTYIGRRWRSVAVFAEQAYLKATFNRFSVKFGRDFAVWGRGRDSALLLSDNTRPFDQLQFRFRTKHLQFSYLTSRLNTLEVSELEGRPLGSTVIKRYLTAGRVDLALLQHRLQFGVSQAVLYGTGGAFEWIYLNPFIIYHGELLNEPRSANSFITLDFAWYPAPGAELYGELLIDDFQIERSTVEDLEPAEYGVTLGGRLADPGAIAGLTLGLEYTRVTNRTYNVPQRYERFLHRNRPIGHFLGNDFDRWLVDIRYFAGRQFLLSATADFVRRGEGRVTAQFDRPWLNSTLEEGYSEPFPTGVVERARTISLQLRWHASALFYAEAEARFRNADNAGHVANLNATTTTFLLKLWFEWHKLIGI